MAGILDFLRTPGGSSLASGILGGVGQMAQGQQQNQQYNQQNAQQQALQAALMQQQNGNNIMGDQLNRDQLVGQAAPLGWAQNYQQQQLAKNFGLQQLMNGPTMTPTNPHIQQLLDQSGYKPFQPTIPDEWKNVNPFGVGQTMEALGNRQNVISQLGGGNAPQLDFSQFGIDPAMVQRLQGSTGQFQQQQQGQTDANIQRLNEAVNMSRNAVPQQQQQGGGGIKGFLGGALKIASPFASLIPGVGPLAGMALGAAGGALGNKMQGGGAMAGAAQGGIGAGMVGAMSRPQVQPQGQSFNNFNFGPPQQQRGFTQQPIPQFQPQQPQPQFGPPQQQFMPPPRSPQYIR